MQSKFSYKNTSVNRVIYTLVRVVFVPGSLWEDLRRSVGIPVVESLSPTLQNERHFLVLDKTRVVKDKDVL